MLGTIVTLHKVTSIASVDPATWNALGHGGSPFLEHGFLLALERSGSVGPGSGWEPHYLLAEQSAHGAKPAMVGGVACYVKHHSYGEYIFDWGWARASARAGISYYPKLVVAVPMTPATGARILLARDVDVATTTSALVEAVRALAAGENCSSIHWLFVTPNEQHVLQGFGFLPRTTFQYHWRNHAYSSFEAFLARMVSRHRKQIRKERTKARESVDEIRMLVGAQIERDHVLAIDRFYRHTSERHGAIDYLRPGFFERLYELLGDRLRIAAAFRRDEMVAGALFLGTEQALYGRYWGACEDIPFLHFELAYYMGIEHAIERGIPRFEAGAQGEHKLPRGFLPTATYSNHWIRDPRLADAVERALVEERREVEGYMLALEQLSPYKRDGED